MKFIVVSVWLLVAIWGQRDKGHCAFCVVLVVHKHDFVSDAVSTKAFPPAWRACYHVSCLKEARSNAPVDGCLFRVCIALTKPRLSMCDFICQNYGGSRVRALNNLGESYIMHVHACIVERNMYCCRIWQCLTYLEDSAQCQRDSVMDS